MYQRNLTKIINNNDYNNNMYIHVLLAVCYFLKVSKQRKLNPQNSLISKNRYKNTKIETAVSE